MSSGFWGHIKAIWGAAFTSLSFLTTTGLTSDYLPEELRKFGQAGIVIAALAIFGGGVATTAGGIKLLRVYILAGHCKTEVDRLIAPLQVMSGQSKSLSKSHHNAMLACVFLMLFILVFAAITLGLTLTGSGVAEALHLTLATVTNTGPLAQGFGGSESAVIELGTGAKLILAVAMVFGRLEVLALLALLNPDIYR
jgi:trk system potassium uptake protein TrkH